MTKTVFYKDEQNDDFGDSHKVTSRTVDANYKYEHKNPLWHIASFVIYYLVVPPVLIFCKVRFGLKFKGRRNLHRIKSGCYVYGNHTHLLDNFIPALLAWPKRAYIITSPRAISSPILSVVVPMLGGVPLNKTEAGKKHFRKYLAKQVERGHIVTIMPEAHLWPYYNKIRKFSERSFTYPTRQKKPVVGYVLTYRKRKNVSKPPWVTVTVGQPIFPNEWKDSKNPKMFLRDKILKFMQDTVKSEKSFGFIKYQKKNT